MSWKDTLRKGWDDEEFGPCEKEFIYAYNEIFHSSPYEQMSHEKPERLEMTWENFERLWGKVEDFLIEWDDSSFGPPTYKDHMPDEDMTHPALEKYRKLAKDYKDCN
tara:strand:- start:1177 stop:1497 length:321 start_codon:yes stop_codon:yes gene_type:complete